MEPALGSDILGQLAGQANMPSVDASNVLAQALPAVSSCRCWTRCGRFSRIRTLKSTHTRWPSPVGVQEGSLGTSGEPELKEPDNPPDDAMRLQTLRSLNVLDARTE